MRTQIEKDSNGKLVYDDQGNPVYKKDAKGNVLYFDSWKRATPKADENIDFAKYGYKSLEELVRWRLHNRTGAGLMAELGSHQLDACSIFLGKKHPLSVTGAGGGLGGGAHAREVGGHVDAKRAQVARRPDARAQQQRWGLDRARAHDDLASSVGPVKIAVMGVLDAGAARALEQ